jgi:hypothetical protein
MTKILFGFLIVNLLLGCEQSENNKLTFSKDSSFNKPVDSINNGKVDILVSHSDTTSNQTDWRNSLLKKYISNTNNELVNLSRKNERALFDRKEDTDNVKYFIFQIGHDFTDPDGKRFITDSWVYIDSAKRKIYEYDVAKDSLVEWNNTKND